MKNKKSSIPGLVDALQSRGKYCFTREDMKKSTGANESLLAKSLWRLEKKQRIVRVKSGFYIIVPLEYSIRGILPPPWFIDDLMRFMGRGYYVGLLSAAALHGSTHQAPQVFQVIVPKVDRDIRSGRLHIQFVRKSSMSDSSILKMKTVTGYMRVSDPAVTAIDLVAYHKQIGGMNRVGVVLEDLAESISPGMLVKAAEKESHLAVLQRLGWFLELLGAHELADPLHHHVHSKRPRYTPLDPEMPRRGFPNQSRWKLIVNTDIELDR